MQSPDDAVNSLWTRVLETARRARRRGALETIPTRSLPLEDGGLTFLIRRVVGLERKPGGGGAGGKDPFARPDPDLDVGPLSETHYARLNKYNVLPEHVLLITRKFERQEAPLTLADCDAACRALRGRPALVFYNAGREAGASQPHKHLQAVPLPLDREHAEWPLPLGDVYAGAVEQRGEGRADALAFEHRVARWSGDAQASIPEAAQALHAAYRRLLATLALDPSPERTGSYNLLVTRQWLAVIPRVRECFGPISLNALAFAGMMLVRDAGELEQLRRAGPLAALRAVTRPLGPPLAGPAA